MRSQDPNPIAQLNKLEHHDWLEAEPLIFQCFEHGVFQWTNPKFLYFLDNVITGLLTLHRHEHRQLRAIIYARVVEELMPAGIDDDLRERIVATSNGTPPAAKLKKNVWHGPSCVWPSYRGSLWSGRAFWVIQHRQQDKELTVSFLRRRAKLKRENCDAS
ncbi:MAG: hypothetical protein ACFB14_14205 [Leptolyngbyaceae cyanobacterium]